MKKLILIVILFFCTSFTAYADFSAADEIYSASGAEELYAGETLEDYGISFENPSSILSVTPAELWKLIKNTVISKVTAPLRLLVSLGIVVVLTALAESLGDTVKKGGTAKVYELVCVLAGVAAVSAPICEVLANSAEALEDGADFMNCFVPVFAGIAAAGGHITSATGYNVLVLTVSDIAIQAANGILMPLLSMCLCLAIVDASCSAVSLKGMLDGVKKLVTWGLGLIMTVFTGLLSIQSIVGSSADTLGSKTAKYVISNCIPVVGGAVSDAYSTVRGSIALLRNGVGSIGIAALAVMLLPPVISLALYRISVSAASAAADIFGEAFKTVWKHRSRVIGGNGRSCLLYSYVYNFYRYNNDGMHKYGMTIKTKDKEVILELLKKVILSACFLSVVISLADSIKPGDRFSRQLKLIFSLIFISGIITSAANGNFSFDLPVAADVGELENYSDMSEAADNAMMYSAEQSVIDEIGRILTAQGISYEKITANINMEADGGIIINEIGYCGAEYERACSIIRSSLGEVEVSLVGG